MGHLGFSGSGHLGFTGSHLGLQPEDVEDPEDEDEEEDEDCVFVVEPVVLRFFVAIKKSEGSADNFWVFNQYFTNSISEPE